MGHLFPLILEDAMKSFTSKDFEVIRAVFQCMDIGIWLESNVFDFRSVFIQNEELVEIIKSKASSSTKKNTIENNKYGNLFRNIHNWDDVLEYLLAALDYYTRASRDFVVKDYESVELNLLDEFGDNN